MTIGNVSSYAAFQVSNHAAAVAGSKVGSQSVTKSIQTDSEVEQPEAVSQTLYSGQGKVVQHSTRDTGQHVDSLV